MNMPEIKTTHRYDCSIPEVADIIAINKGESRLSIYFQGANSGMTPRQARQLAAALFAMADKLDPGEDLREGELYEFIGPGQFNGGRYRLIQSHDGLWRLQGENTGSVWAYRTSTPEGAFGGHRPQFQHVEEATP
jgi:hypothetical protein